MRILISILLVAGLIACQTREEKLKEAEQEAQFLADKKAALLKGLGESMQGRGAEGARDLGQGVGDVLKGVAKGLDASLGSLPVEVSASLTERGVKAERAGQRGAVGRDQGDEPKQEVIAVYLIYERPFAGTLRLRALEKDGREVGRATANVDAPAGAAAYVDFSFDGRTPLKLVDRVELSAP